MTYIPAKLLVAAAALEAAGQRPFAAAALVVAAWTRYPETFGLAGFEATYPDSNKVLSALMGKDGLVKRGLLDRLAPKTYALTPAGREMAERGETARAAPTPHKRERPANALDIRHGNTMGRLLDSIAARKADDNRREAVTFADACVFWAVAGKVRSCEVKRRLNKLARALAAAEAATDAGDVTLPDGRVMCGGDVRVLMNVHTWMMGRFERQLKLLRGGAT